MSSHPIYLDFNATTPVDPRVADAMEPYLREHFGNPSSGHDWGVSVHNAIEKARQQVATLLQADSRNVIFTSGGTEANNMAIIGSAPKGGGGHIITTAVEHPAVSEVCDHLAEYGVTTTKVGVNSAGQVNPNDIEAALKPDTFLITVMLANNEVGTLQPVAEIAEIARARGILSHTDCAQAVGKVPVGLQDLGVDMISVASHKIYGPKGIGALITAPGIQLRKIMFGADHECGRRPGTENVLGIIGMGHACSLIADDLPEEIAHLNQLRDLLAKALLTAHPEAQINGHATERLPNTLSVSWPGRVAGEILANLPDVAASAGAACHSEGVHISHVLTAMGVPHDFALGTLRLSLGRMSKKDEVLAGAERIKDRKSVV